MGNLPDDLSSKSNENSSTFRDFANNIFQSAKSRLLSKMDKKNNISGKSSDISHGIYLFGRKKDNCEPAMAKITCHGLTDNENICEYLGKNSFPVGISNREESSVKSCIVCSSPGSAVDRLHCILKIEDENLVIYDNASAQGIRIKLNNENTASIGNRKSPVGFNVKQRRITFGVGWLSFDLELLPYASKYLSSNDATLLIENTRSNDERSITAVVRNNYTLGRANADIQLSDNSISRYFAYFKLSPGSNKIISVVDSDIFTLPDGTKCREVELISNISFTCGYYKFTVLNVFNGFGFEQDCAAKPCNDSECTHENAFDRLAGVKKSYSYLISENDSDDCSPVMRFTFSGPFPREIEPVEITRGSLPMSFTTAPDAVEGSQFVFTDKSLGVERSHCSIDIRKGRLIVTDNKSTVGTKIVVKHGVKVLGDGINEDSLEISERKFSISIGFATVHCELLPEISKSLSDRFVTLRITNIRRSGEQPYEVKARDGNTIGRASNDIPLTDETEHRFLGHFSITQSCARLIAIDQMNYFTLMSGQKVSDIKLTPNVEFTSRSYKFEVIECFDGIKFDDCNNPKNQ